MTSVCAAYGKPPGRDLGGYDAGADAAIDAEVGDWHLDSGSNDATSGDADRGEGAVDARSESATDG